MAHDVQTYTCGATPRLYPDVVYACLCYMHITRSGRFIVQCLHICIFTFTHIYIYLLYIYYIDVSVICIHICIYIYVDARMCTYIDMYIYVCTKKFISIHTCLCRRYVR